MYNIGIIGYGGFGKFLHHSWNRLKNVNIIAVADLLESCDPGGGIKFYKQWQDLIKDNEIDIVSIATPPCFHAEIACAAMKAEKHVLLEKPMAITIEGGKRIIATRDQTGKKATIDYMMRFNPIVEALYLLSHQKIFGELRRVDVENYAQNSELPPAHWFWNPDISGGILIEHGVHFIDLVNSLTDEHYQQVNGICYSHNKQENKILAEILYEKGLIVTHYHSFSRPGFFEYTSIRLSYDLAQIDLKGWLPLSGWITALVNKETEKKLLQLPEFKVRQLLGIDQLPDISRPEGWGGDSQQSKMAPRGSIRSGGIEYHVDKMVCGTFNISRPKSEVYSDCLRAVLGDLIKAIENPRNSVRVKLEDGLTSLEIAVLATKSGRHYTTDFHF